MKSRYPFLFRAAAWMVLSCFAMQDIAQAAPDLGPSRLSLAGTPGIRLNLPESVARLESAWLSPRPGPTLFLFQDAHANESGQINLAKALDLVLSKEKISTVFTEAGVGDDSLAFLKNYGTPDARRAAGLESLRKNRIKGTEFLSMTSTNDFTLWGVEDPKLYARALESYRSVEAEREKFRAYLQNIAVTIGVLKQKLYNPALLELDSKREAFDREDIALTSYLDQLMREARRLGLSAVQQPELLKMMRIRQIESGIHFDRASAEQAEAIRSLSPQDRELIEKGVPKDSLKILHEDIRGKKAFYLLLAEKCGGFRRYPELRKYAAYLRAADKLDPHRLLDERKALEAAVFTALAASSDESRLANASKFLDLLQSLLELKLTPEEFASFKNGFKGYNIARMDGFLNRKLMDLGSHYERALFLEDDFDRIIREAESFYASTHERDEIFIARSLEKMVAEGESKAVLVTGGYHTPNLKRLLQAKGVSYAVITPQVYYSTDVKKYERLLLSQSTLMFLDAVLHAAGRQELLSIGSRLTSESDGSRKRFRTEAAARFTAADTRLKERQLLDPRAEENINPAGARVRQTWTLSDSDFKKTVQYLEQRILRRMRPEVYRDRIRPHFREPAKEQNKHLPRLWRSIARAIPAFGDGFGDLGSQFRYGKKNVITVSGHTQQIGQKALALAASDFTVKPHGWNFLNTGWDPRKDKRVAEAFSRIFPQGNSKEDAHFRELFNLFVLFHDVAVNNAYFESHANHADRGAMIAEMVMTKLNETVGGFSDNDIRFVSFLVAKHTDFGTLYLRERDPRQLIKDIAAIDLPEEYRRRLIGFLALETVAEVRVLWNPESDRGRILSGEKAAFYLNASSEKGLQGMTHGYGSQWKTLRPLVQNPMSFESMGTDLGWSYERLMFYGSDRIGNLIPARYHQIMSELSGMPVELRHQIFEFLSDPGVSFDYAYEVFQNLSPTALVKFLYILTRIRAEQRSHDMDIRFNASTARAPSTAAPMNLALRGVSYEDLRSRGPGSAFQRVVRSLNITLNAEGAPLIHNKWFTEYRLAAQTRKSAFKAARSLENLVQSRGILLDPVLEEAIRTAKVEETAEVLVDAVPEDRADELQAVMLAIGLPVQGARNAALERISDALSAQDPKAKVQALKQIGNYGSDAAQFLPQMLLAMKDNDSYVREAAAIAIPQLGAIAMSAMPNLSKLLEDSDSYVRQRAVETIAALGPDAIDAAALSVIDVLKRYPDDHPVERARLIRLLVRRPMHPAVLSELDFFAGMVRSTENKNGQARIAAIELLAAVGPKFPAVVPVLIEALDYDPYHGVRIASAQALGSLKIQDPQIRQALSRAVANDRDSYVQKAAREALRRLYAPGARTPHPRLQLEKVIREFPQAVELQWQDETEGLLNALNPVAVFLDRQSFSPNDPSAFERTIEVYETHVETIRKWGIELKFTKVWEPFKTYTRDTVNAIDAAERHMKMVRDLMNAALNLRKIQRLVRRKYPANAEAAEILNEHLTSLIDDLQSMEELDYGALYPRLQSLLDMSASLSKNALDSYLKVLRSDRDAMQAQLLAYEVKKVLRNLAFSPPFEEFSGPAPAGRGASLAPADSAWRLVKSIHKLRLTPGSKGRLNVNLTKAAYLMGGKPPESVLSVNPAMTRDINRELNILFRKNAALGEKEAIVAELKTRGIKSIRILKEARKGGRRSQKTPQGARTPLERAENFDQIFAHIERVLRKFAQNPLLELQYNAVENALTELLKVSKITRWLREEKYVELAGATEQEKEVAAALTSDQPDKIFAALDPFNRSVRAVLATEAPAFDMALQTKIEQVVKKAVKDPNHLPDDTRLLEIILSVQIAHLIQLANNPDVYTSGFFAQNPQGARAQPTESRQIHAGIHAELKSADEIISHFPREGADKYARIEALLSVLYGGEVLYHGLHHHRLNGEREWQAHRHSMTGLLELLSTEELARNGLADLLPSRFRSAKGHDIRSRISLNPNEIKRIVTLAKLAVRKLEGLEIRPHHFATLKIDPKYQNSFLHTFFGVSRGKPLTTAQSRIERAIEVGGFSAEDEAYIRKFHNHFQPEFHPEIAKHFTKEEVLPLLVRDVHNVDRGPAKGGDRVITERALKADPVFMAIFGELKKVMNLEELRYFLRKWLKEETQPLAFGMTTKCAVVDLPYGGGKGVVQLADVFKNSAGDFDIANYGSSLDPADQRRVRADFMRSFVRMLFEAGFVGPKIDIAAPDIGSGAWDMDIMTDEYLKLHIQRARKSGEFKSYPKDLQQKLNEIKRDDQDRTKFLAIVDRPYLSAVAAYFTRLRETGFVMDESTPLGQLGLGLASFTSKSLQLDKDGKVEVDHAGSFFRPESTGYGEQHVLKRILEIEGLKNEFDQSPTAKMEGLGGVGLVAAREAIKDGFKLQAVAERGGVIYKETGFTAEDLEILQLLINAPNGFSDINTQPAYTIKDAKPMSKGDFLHLSTFVFYANAKENSITKDNVMDLNARVVIEGANGPVTNEAYDVLIKSGITVIPDSIANAGGVTVSYLEWIQNRKNERWPRKAIVELMKGRLTQGIIDVDTIRKAKNTDWRTAADILAITRVLKARDRGRISPLGARAPAALSGKALREFTSAYIGLRDQKAAQNEPLVVQIRGRNAELFTAGQPLPANVRLKVVFTPTKGGSDVVVDIPPSMVSQISIPADNPSAVDLTVPLDLTAIFGNPNKIFHYITAAQASFDRGSTWLHGGAKDNGQVVIVPQLYRDPDPKHVLENKMRLFKKKSREAIASKVMAALEKNGDLQGLRPQETRQMQISFESMLEQVMKTGAIIASHDGWPRYRYFYNWQRDSWQYVRFMMRLYSKTRVPELRQLIEKAFAFALASDLRKIPNAQRLTVLGHAIYEPSNDPKNYRKTGHAPRWGEEEGWGLQNDGPAHAVSAAIDYLRMMHPTQAMKDELVDFIDEQAGFLIKNLYKPADDLWEEISARHHIYTVLIQLDALHQLVKLNTMNGYRIRPLQARHGLGKLARMFASKRGFLQVKNGSKRLVAHLKPDGRKVHEKLARIKPDNLDSSSIGGLHHAHAETRRFLVHQSGGYAGILRTIMALDEAFIRDYQINREGALDSYTVLWGRYEHDVYNGEPISNYIFTEANPWYVTSLWRVQEILSLAQTVAESDPANGQIWKDPIWNEFLKHNGILRIPATQAELASLLFKIAEANYRDILKLVKGTPGIAEQIDRYNGEPRGVYPLATYSQGGFIDTSLQLVSTRKALARAAKPASAPLPQGSRTILADAKNPESAAKIQTLLSDGFYEFYDQGTYGMADASLYADQNAVQQRKIAADQKRVEKTKEMLKAKVEWALAQETPKFKAMSDRLQAMKEIAAKASDPEKARWGRFGGIVSRLAHVTQSGGNDDMILFAIHVKTPDPKKAAEKAVEWNILLAKEIFEMVPSSGAPGEKDLAAEFAFTELAKANGIYFTPDEARSIFPENYPASYRARVAEKPVVLADYIKDFAERRVVHFLIREKVMPPLWAYLDETYAKEKERLAISDPMAQAAMVDEYRGSPQRQKLIQDVFDAFRGFDQNRYLRERFSPIFAEVIKGVDPKKWRVSLYFEALYKMGVIDSVMRDEIQEAGRLLAMATEPAIFVKWSNQVNRILAYRMSIDSKWPQDIWYVEESAEYHKATLDFYDSLSAAVINPVLYSYYQKIAGAMNKLTGNSAVIPLEEPAADSRITDEKITAADKRIVQGLNRMITGEVTFSAPTKTIRKIMRELASETEQLMKEIEPYYQMTDVEVDAPDAKAVVQLIGWSYERMHFMTETLEAVSHGRKGIELLTPEGSRTSVQTDPRSPESGAKAADVLKNGFFELYGSGEYGISPAIQTAAEMEAQRRRISENFERVKKIKAALQSKLEWMRSQDAPKFAALKERLNRMSEIVRAALDPEKARWGRFAAIVTRVTHVTQSGGQDDALFAFVEKRQPTAKDPEEERVFFAKELLETLPVAAEPGQKDLAVEFVFTELAKLNGVVFTPHEVQALFPENYPKLISARKKGQPVVLADYLRDFMERRTVHFLIRKFLPLIERYQYALMDKAKEINGAASSGEENDRLMTEYIKSAAYLKKITAVYDAAETSETHASRYLKDNFYPLVTQSFTAKGRNMPNIHDYFWALQKMGTTEALLRDTLIELHLILDGAVSPEDFQLFHAKMRQLRAYLMMVAKAIPDDPYYLEERAEYVAAAQAFAESLRKEFLPILYDFNRHLTRAVNQMTNGRANATLPSALNAGAVTADDLERSDAGVYKALNRVIAGEIPVQAPPSASQESMAQARRLFEQVAAYHELTHIETDEASVGIIVKLVQVTYQRMESFYKTAEALSLGRREGLTPLPPMGARPGARGMVALRSLDKALALIKLQSNAQQEEKETYISLQLFRKALAKEKFKPGWNAHTYAFQEKMLKLAIGFYQKRAAGDFKRIISHLEAAVKELRFMSIVDQAYGSLTEELESGRKISDYLPDFDASYRQPLFNLLYKLHSGKWAASKERSAGAVRAYRLLIPGMISMLDDKLAGGEITWQASQDLPAAIAVLKDIDARLANLVSTPDNASGSRAPEGAFRQSIVEFLSNVRQAIPASAARTLPLDVSQAAAQDEIMLFTQHAQGNLVEVSAKGLNGNVLPGFTYDPLALQARLVSAPPVVSSGSLGMYAAKPALNMDLQIARRVTAAFAELGLKPAPRLFKLNPEYLLKNVEEAKKTAAAAELQKIFEVFRNAGWGYFQFTGNRKFGLEDDAVPANVLAQFGALIEVHVWGLDDVIKPPAGVVSVAISLGKDPDSFIPLSATLLYGNLLASQKAERNRLDVADAIRQTGLVLHRLTGRLVRLDSGALSRLWDHDKLAEAQGFYSQYTIQPFTFQDLANLLEFLRLSSRESAIKA